VLDTLLALSPAKNDIRVETDEARMRPSDVPLLYGDATKFHARTGWKPEYTFERTMGDLLNYWREIIRRS
jgi:GDP-D-mannose dehydratase